MPILGIVASQITGHLNPFTPTGSYDALASYTIGSGGASEVVFSGLPTGGQYSHLQIRVIGRTSGTGNRTHTIVQFNSDTGSNYRWHTLAGTGASAVSEDAGSAVSFIRIGSSNLPMGDAGSNIFGVTVADILDYASTTKNKVTRSLAGQDQNDTTGRISFGSGLWLNTSAINSIKVYPDGANWAQYTNISLYGVKG